MTQQLSRLGAGDGYMHGPGDKAVVETQARQGHICACIMVQQSFVSIALRFVGSLAARRIGHADNEHAALSVSVQVK